MTVGKKIALGFGALIVIACGLGGVATYKMTAIRAEALEIGDDRLPGVDAIGAIISMAKDCRADTYDHLAASTLGEMDAVEAKLAALKTDIDRGAVAYEKTIHDPEDRRLFAEVGPALTHFREIRAHSLVLHREGKNAEAQRHFATVALPAFDQMMGKLEAVRSYKRRNGDEATQTILAATRSGVTTVATGLGVAVLAGAAIGFLIVRGIGAALGRMAATLREGSGRVAAASGQVSAGSQSLAQGASEQAAALEESTSALEEMASMTRKNAETAAQARQLSGEAQRAASRGG